MIAVFSTGISNPAVQGQDFEIVDMNGITIQPVDGKYSIVFPKAERKLDTIYVRLLNSSVPVTRKKEVRILENETEMYYVDIFSTAYRRPVEIKQTAIFRESNIDAKKEVSK